MGALVLTWDVQCPTCGALPKRRCRNSRGELLKFHVARTKAAAAARIVAA